jgi:hypothetical protein
VVTQCVAQRLLILQVERQSKKILTKKIRKYKTKLIFLLLLFTIPPCTRLSVIGTPFVGVAEFSTTDVNGDGDQ